MLCCCQVSLQTAAQHADLMHKVEQLNLLQDSNRFLREEKDRLVQQYKEMEEKVTLKNIGLRYRDELLFVLAPLDMARYDQIQHN